jgi:hypothetical protein
MGNPGQTSELSGPAFQPLEPYRQAEISTSQATSDVPSPHSGQAKMVGSRTFALEYELDEIGREGVSLVELWGTRDGGQTWRQYARDDDNHSPLIVTVDEEGMYGFRILVGGSRTAPPIPPAQGDSPELWVNVDLRRPVAELTAVEPGRGNMSDQLVLRWRAADDNLLSRPVSLYYRSRSTGPWSAVATNLENTGEYAWRVERHVPARFYLRLEVLDAARNLTAFETRDPIEFAPPTPGGRLQSAEPIDPTAAGANASYR